MTKRMWFIVSAIYCVVFVLFIGIRWQGIAKNQISPFDSLLLAPLLLGSAAHGLQYGYVSGRGFRLTRAKGPRRHCFIVALSVSGGLFFLIFGICGLLR